MAILDVLKVFLFAFVIDILWVVYIYAMTRKRALMAAATSAMIGAPTLLGMLEIVDDRSLIMPYLFGLSLGTVVGMKLGEKINGK